MIVLHKTLGVALAISAHIITELLIFGVVFSKRVMLRGVEARCFAVFHKGVELLGRRCGRLTDLHCSSNYYYLALSLLVLNSLCGGLWWVFFDCVTCTVRRAVRLQLCLLVQVLYSDFALSTTVDWYVSNYHGCQGT